jgi:hypothetical protein
MAEITHKERVAANTQAAIAQQRRIYDGMLAQAADADTRGDVVIRDQLLRQAGEYADTRMIAKPAEQYRPGSPGETP